MYKDVFYIKMAWTEWKLCYYGNSQNANLLPYNNQKTIPISERAYEKLGEVAFFDSEKYTDEAMKVLSQIVGENFIQRVIEGRKNADTSPKHGDIRDFRYRYWQENVWRY